MNISPTSTLLVIFGYGDGKLVSDCVEDRRIREKDLFIVAFNEAVPKRYWPERTQLMNAHSWDDLQQWILAHFSDHNDIIRLGGADFIDAAGLSAESAQMRDALKPRALELLADRPWALGNDINDTFMGLWHATLNAPALLPAPSIGQICGSFGQTPAISIGAGPSIATHLDQLRALQDKCLLVACDSVCPGLVKEGIIPHVVTPLERLKQQAQFVSCLKDTRAIFAGIPACHPDTVAPFGERTIYLHALDKLYDWLAPQETLRCLAGSSTGVLSFYVAASLTRGPVYLVGHDLAKEDGASHWDGAAFASKAFAAEAKNAGGFGTNGYEERMVMGNSGQMLRSIMWWDHFRGEIASQAVAMGNRVFNVNAHHGVYAKIEHTLPAPLPDPASLPDMSVPVPQRVNQARLDEWRSRAHNLGSDAASFIRGMGHLREKIAGMRLQSCDQWDLDSLMGCVIPDQHVSPGNLAAFQYVLRSAIYNEQAYGCWRARGFASRNEAYWTTMQSIDGLADAMSNAVEHLLPLMDKAAQ